jgi:hypothetical protein
MAQESLVFGEFVDEVAAPIRWPLNINVVEETPYRFCVVEKRVPWALEVRHIGDPSHHVRGHFYVNSPKCDLEGLSANTANICVELANMLHECGDGSGCHRHPSLLVND